MSGAAAGEDQELRALAESAYEALNARDLTAS
jgi:hypothetical protein